MREEERKKEERRTRRPKQVPFHNRTHRNFLSFACVETPHSDVVLKDHKRSSMLLHLHATHLSLLSSECVFRLAIHVVPSNVLQDLGLGSQARTAGGLEIWCTNSQIVRGSWCGLGCLTTVLQVSSDTKTPTSSQTSMSYKLIQSRIQIPIYLQRSWNDSGWIPCRTQCLGSKRRKQNRQEVGRTDSWKRRMQFNSNT